MKKLMGALAIFFTLASQAQTNNHITGRVIDGSQKTIESATISLLRARDSVAVKLAAADKAGQFAFDNIPAGQYLVSISAVGHQKGFSETFQVEDHKDLQVKTIQLIPQDKTLGTVTVTAKRPLVEHKIDRTIVNVDASITNAGGTALEVLQKSPGVTVDKDGNISLKGKDGVLVLVDG